jgi:hypothetical protein
MSTNPTIKRKRIRPGLYHLVLPTQGDMLVAIIERGGETGVWWWRAIGVAKGGCAGTLLVAHGQAERSVRG